MKNIVHNLLIKLGLSKPYKVQTFTYYIPSPPNRKSGYREKQFDKLFYQFINMGYSIIDMKTQSSTGEGSSGMWVLFVVQATNKKADSLDLDLELNDQFSDKKSGEESIDGLYQINN